MLKMINERIQKIFDEIRVLEDELHVALNAQQCTLFFRLSESVSI